MIKVGQPTHSFKLASNITFNFFKQILITRLYPSKKKESLWKISHIYFCEDTSFNILRVWLFSGKWCSSGKFSYTESIFRCFVILNWWKVFSLRKISSTNRRKMTQFISGQISVRLQISELFHLLQLTGKHCWLLLFISQKHYHCTIYNIL